MRDVGMGKVASSVFIIDGTAGKSGCGRAGNAASRNYITDLNTDSEEWDAYSVGEKVDLDNDGSVYPDNLKSSAPAWAVVFSFEKQGGLQMYELV